MLCPNASGHCWRVARSRRFSSGAAASLNLIRGYPRSPLLLAIGRAFINPNRTLKTQKATSILFSSIMNQSVDPLDAETSTRPRACAPGRWPVAQCNARRNLSAAGCAPAPEFCSKISPCQKNQSRLDQRYWSVRGQSRIDPRQRRLYPRQRLADLVPLAPVPTLS